MATEIKSTSIKSQNIIAEPQTNKPGSPEAGQIIQATGTGDIAKGIYHYSGAAWMSLDNAQGDLETLRLIMSTDTDAVGFSSALNSTSTLAGNTNAVPHETSTGTGLLGALEIPSTGGDALLTEFDANKVFRYFSAGANNNNDYFGIPIDIPAQTRGQNIVIKFKYRTEEASDTTSNGDFQVSVWDKTNGVKTTSTNTSTVSAGSAITVASSTGMAVGDKIWLESGGQSTIGNVAATLTQAYITEVTNSTSIKISEDWTPATASGSLVVSGWLSDKTSGLLPSADSDTNKVGKDFSIAVKTEEDTAQIVLYISNKSTTTNVIELFFDGILVSQNKFLQASSQTKSESYSAFYQASFWDASTSTYEFNPNLLLPKGGSPPLAQSNFLDIGDITGPGTTGTVTAVKAKQDIILHTNVGVAASSTGDIRILDSNGDRPVISGHTGVAGLIEADLSIKLSKGDYIFFFAVQPSATNGFLTVTAEPQTSDVILLESQDEIFTDWQSWTPTWGGFTTATGSFHYRRNGANLEMLIDAIPGTTSTSNVSFSLPSGYVIDGTKFDDTVNTPIAAAAKNTFLTGNYAWVVGSKSTEQDFTKIFIGIQNGTNSSFNRVAGTSFGTGAELTGFISVPIQGWSSNFNPLLSMPLVNIGSDLEQYSLNGWTGNAGTLSLYSTNAPNINTIDKLGTISTMSSTVAWSFTASQRVKVNIAAQYGQSTGQNWFSIASGPASTAGDQDKSFDHVDVLPLNKSVTITAGAGDAVSTTASFIMDPGEVCMIHLNGTGSVLTAAYQGGVWMTAERDRSNTNMAHIIKPAVAVLSDVKGGTTNGGSSVSTGWTARELNTINGESWFVTLSGTGTTGLGGTNTDFTLEPGTYEIEAFGPFYSTAYSQHRLYDKTNSEIAIVGTNNQTVTANGFINGPVYGVLNVTASTEYCLQYRVSVATSTYGLGEDSTFSDAGDISKFANVKIRKLK